MSGAAAAAASGTPVGKVITWQTEDIPEGTRARGTFELTVKTDPNPITYYVVCREDEIVTLSLRKDEDRVVPSTTALTTRRVHLQGIGLTSEELVLHNDEWKNTPDEKKEKLHLYAAFFDKMTGTQVLRWLNALKDLTQGPADDIIADIKAIYAADQGSGKDEN